MNSLMESFGYEFIHISGYCNLYCKKDLAPSWLYEPQLNEEELRFFDGVWLPHIKALLGFYL